MHAKRVAYELNLRRIFDIVNYDTPHKLHLIQAVRDFGCRKEKVDEIVEKHRKGLDEETLLAGDYTEAEKKFIEEVFHTYGNGKAHLEWLDELLPYTVYIHGKFWYLDDDETDHTVPCDKILPIIKNFGYKGYIASEYEGHHFSEKVDSCEQLKRWVNMSKKILNQS